LVNQYLHCRLELDYLSCSSLVELMAFYSIRVTFLQLLVSTTYSSIYSEFWSILPGSFTMAREPINHFSLIENNTDIFRKTNRFYDFNILITCAIVSVEIQFRKTSCPLPFKACEHTLYRISLSLGKYGHQWETRKSILKRYANVSWIKELWLCQKTRLIKGFICTYYL